MIKTALSASLIALAVLAPVASAADEVKPPRQTDQAAPTCVAPPTAADPKAPPAPRLTKLELEALKKLPLCPSEEPRGGVPADRRGRVRQGGRVPLRPPAPLRLLWVQEHDLCMRRQLGNQSGADGTHH